MTLGPQNVTIKCDQCGVVEDVPRQHRDTPEAAQSFDWGRRSRNGDGDLCPACKGDRTA